MRIKETISADEVGALEDILPEFRQTKTQSEICERKYGIKCQILKDENGGIYPACVDKITGKVIWDIYPGCHNVNGECPIHKKLREEKEANSEK